jgi:hypothetical protein
MFEACIQTLESQVEGKPKHNTIFKYPSTTVLFSLSRELPHIRVDIQKGQIIVIINLINFIFRLSLLYYERPSDINFFGDKKTLESFHTIK